jgi:lysine-specific demethylase 8
LREPYAARNVGIAISALSELKISTTVASRGCKLPAKMACLQVAMRRSKWGKTVPTVTTRLIYSLNFDPIPDCDADTFKTAISKKHPCVWRKGALAWPCCQLDHPYSWQNLNRFLQLPNATVQVEEGGTFRDDGFQQHVPVELHDFINQLKERASGTPKQYLAQYDLLFQYPELTHDFSTLDVLQHSHIDLYQTLVWLGPAATRSLLHFDPYDNIFVQVSGSKSVVLVQAAPREAAIFAYPARNRRNFSRVDLTKSPPDIEATYPGFSSLPRFHAMLNAGDVLYIPQGLWHEIVSFTTSASLSYWFRTRATRETAD